MKKAILLPAILIATALQLPSSARTLAAPPSSGPPTAATPTRTPSTGRFVEDRLGIISAKRERALERELGGLESRGIRIRIVTIPSILDQESQPLLDSVLGDKAAWVLVFTSKPNAYLRAPSRIEPAVSDPIYAKIFDRVTDAGKAGLQSAAADGINDLIAFAKTADD